MENDRPVRAVRWRYGTPDVPGMWIRVPMAIDGQAAIEKAKLKRIVNCRRLGQAWWLGPLPEFENE